MSNRHADTEARMDALRTRAAAARSLHELRALARPADLPARRIALRSLSPALLSRADLAHLARERDVTARRSLFQNDGLSDSDLAFITLSSLSHEDHPVAIAEWVRELWNLFAPPRDAVVRSTLRQAAFGAFDLVSSLRYDIALAVLTLDETLSCGDLLRLVSSCGDDERALRAALLHPAADVPLWEHVLDVTEYAPNDADWLLLLLRTPAREHPRVRTLVLLSGLDTVFEAFAPHVRADEVIPLLTSARRVRADELAIVRAMPASLLTTEVRAFLLEHPQIEVRMAVMTSLSAAQPSPPAGRTQRR